MDEDVEDQDEQQGDNAEEAAQGSNEEAALAVFNRRRKGKGKLKLNENRTRMGNKRISKNVADVSIENVALNSKEEDAKWIFVASQRIAAQRMMFELVREFICNMMEHIDDLINLNFQKVTLGNFTFEFSPSIMNGYFSRANGGETSYNLKFLEIIKVLTGGVVNTCPTKGAGSRVYHYQSEVDAGNDIPLRSVDTGGGLGSGNDETGRFIRDEIRHLESVI
ncbi:hypothetical protein LIER_19435 [Lithospermum erythrorhizon]|uniref:Uncharacterized protein n=1 Tax=Lithospermum erythrorhizon TaxID=34254 RepID=A0AAV3QIM5_LITER